MSQSAARIPDPPNDDDHDTPGELIVGPWAPIKPDPVEPEPEPPAAVVAPRPAAPPLTCRCGNVTARGHNGFSCDEVLAIRRRVERSR